MSSNQSETGAQQANEATAESEPQVHPLQEYADEVAEVVGGTAEIHFDTIKVKVPAETWVDTHVVARDQLGLIFFSWLSAIDWSNQVEVGDPLSEEVEERLELLTTVGDISEGRRVTFSTDLDQDGPAIPSLIEVYAGAEWHEREAHEMFGIDFLGHPNLAHLYLPDGFIGHPLRKSFPLLTREVKPWPGKVDVEAMPEKASTENPES